MPLKTHSVLVQVRVTVAVGKPIRLPKSAHPDEVQVEKYKALFIESMTELYHKHQKAAGYEHKPLQVL